MDKIETIDIDIWSVDNPTTYNIIIGSHVIKNVSEYINFEHYSRVGILTDEKVAPLWLDNLVKSIPIKVSEIVIGQGEEVKNIDNVRHVWEELLTLGFDRKSLLLNLGGGVIGDLGGFAASTFMRGLPYAHIPTTLLSQVDSSIGGKVGVNFGEVKNLIGSFSQPEIVVIDVNTLNTLPNRELMAGFAEVIKHGLIKDEDYLDDVVKKKQGKLSEKDFVQIVKRSCDIKAKVVEEDERENGVRKMLNFGHSIGHALEALSHVSQNESVNSKPGDNADYLLHGEAVALGMIVASEISKEVGLLKEKDVDKIREILSKFHLPTELEFELSPNVIIEKVMFDKKNVSGKINWTLLKGIGNAVFDVSVEKEIVQKALKSIM
jgi:3-dehydroquinate synthase